MTELSVVLITKNQAWNVSRLIESVLHAVSAISSKEIILVDSASTDKTVERANCYPINILCLKPDQKLSPAIGRYVGYKQTHGEYVLFLDGDTVLMQGWLPQALRVMRQTATVGAVSGHVINLPTSAVEDNVPTPTEMQTVGARDVLWGSYGGGGAALYRRSVLEEVGTFNPYLNSDEEPELGLRIRHAGYRIIELDYPIVRHYNDQPVAISTVLSRRRRKFLLGIGQGARYHLGSRLMWPWIKERWWGPTAVVSLIAGIGALFWGLILGNFTWFGLWILALCLFIGCAAYRKRNLRLALVSALSRLFMAEGFLRGFLMRPFPPESFRANFQVVKESRTSL